MMESFVDAAGMATEGGGASGAAGGSTAAGSYGGGAYDLMGGVMGWMGTEKANRTNRANQQWAFSSSLDARRTAVQDRVKDLEAAGLNPVLAASSGNLQGAGGAEASGGAPAGNPGQNAVSSAFAAAQTRKAEAESRNVESQTAINNVEVARVVQDTLLKGATAEQVKAITGRVESEVQKIRTEVEFLESSMRKQMTERDRLRAAEALDRAKAELVKLESIHSALSMNRSIAESDKAGNWWGKHVSPYLGDLSNLVGSAAQGRFIMKGVGK